METAARRLVFLPALALLLGSCRVAAPAAPPVVPTAAVPLPAQPQMQWWRDSMVTREQRLGWWREARFGMFMHWGVYSELAGVWDGTPVTGYAEHIQRMRKIPVAVYRERAAAHFNPVGFDADAWVRALKDAGMGYLIITAKHHDGFAMYDSDVSDYNVVKATPWKRDPMRALKDACTRQGVKFGFYYSHAFDWADPDAPGNDWEHDNPGGDRQLHGGATWWEAEPALLARVRRYVDGKAIPQVQELIRKYDPDIMWFDTPHKLPPEETLRILHAARQAKPTLVVNSRVCQPVPGAGPLPTGFGDYLSTSDKPAEFAPRPGDWEGIPTTNESYGYHRLDQSHKPPAHFIALLAKAAARGGNVLLNIGPMGDGRLDPKDLAILAGIGGWMKVNGESIRGTTRTPLPVQAWGESTRRGATLYLHVLSWPHGGRVVVGGLRTPVARAYLLSDPRRAPLAVEQLADDLVIEGPAAAPDAVDSVVVLETAGTLVVDGRRLLSTDVSTDTLRTFDGELHGGLAFGGGKARDAWVHGWSRPEGTVRWPARLTAPGTFDVFASYDADQASVGGTYVVKIGPSALAGIVQKTPRAPVALGRVTLAPGTFDVSVEPTKISGSELMRLRALVLRPVPGATALR
jgi:alpha-L-fucosidase